MSEKKKIVVVGSVNLDIVVTVDRLPVAGETVTGGRLSKFPGGKGANQALAAQRMGAKVSLVACVGADANADDALCLLRENGVDLAACRVDPGADTGVAMIAVSKEGENQIVVVPGANRALTVEHVVLPEANALICQLEVPAASLVAAISAFDGFISVNLAPAREVPQSIIDSASLLVVNETEASFYGDRFGNFSGFLAITYGSDGAVLLKDGAEIARARPPVITAVDTTGAGDTFTAALTLAMIENRSAQDALHFACAAGAAAATKAGAQPSLPSRAEVEALL